MYPQPPSKTFTHMHTRVHVCSMKVKEDGINISDWLQSLAKFTGAVCRK